MSNSIPIQPLGKRVVVTPDQVEEKTAGGLYVPASANEDKKSDTGTVVALGIVNDKDFKFTVEAGNRVYFKKYSPEEVEINGEKYYILDEEDILAVVK
ncbi:MAG TPA: co-chaperone GroES [Candidatus Dojkabacteria bacterium]|nr:co-chaperone GroES [Candidatus Dojkabacteria bacterium]